jgi:hypothetical protein
MCGDPGIKWVGKQGSSGEEINYCDHCYNMVAKSDPESPALKAMQPIQAAKKGNADTNDFSKWPYSKQRGVLINEIGVKVNFLVEFGDEAAYDAAKKAEAVVEQAKADKKFPIEKLELATDSLEEHMDRTEGPDNGEVKAAKATSEGAQEFISEEIGHLIKDKGYEPSRAKGAAYNIARRKGYKAGLKPKADGDAGVADALKNLISVAEKLPQPATKDGLDLADALAKARGALPKDAKPAPKVEAFAAFQASIKRRTGLTASDVGILDEAAFALKGGPKERGADLWIGDFIKAHGLRDLAPRAAKPTLALTPWQKEHPGDFVIPEHMRKEYKGLKPEEGYPDSKKRLAAPGAAKPESELSPKLEQIYKRGADKLSQEDLDNLTDEDFAAIMRHIQKALAMKKHGWAAK